MPDLSKAEIQNLINRGKLNMLSIDTTVFERSRNFLERGLLGQLSQFSHPKVELVLSDIVIGEVASHMTSAIVKSDAKLKDAINKNIEVRNIDAELFQPVISKSIDQESPNDITERRIQNFIDRTEAVIVKAGDLVLVENLVSAYFLVTPPFDTVAQKKNEFPDAMALHSLEAYAKEKRKKMLVVSADNGWKNFCRESEFLVYEQNLGIAMGYFQHLPGVAESRMYKNHINFYTYIEDELISHIESMRIRISTNPEYIVKSAYKAKFKNFKYKKDKPFILINYDKKSKHYTFAANIDIDISIHASFHFYIRSEGNPIYVGISEVIKMFSQFGSIMLEVKSNNLNEDMDLESIEIIYVDNSFDFEGIEPDLSSYRIS